MYCKLFMKKTLILVIACLFWSLNSLAQSTSQDSIAQLPLSQQIEAYKTLVKKYLYNDLDQALHWVELGMKVANKQQDKKAIGFFWLNKGVIYDNQTKYAQALVYYKKALSIALENDYSTGAAKTYQNIGVTYAKQGKYKQCMTFFFKALRIYEQNKDTTHAIGMYNNLAILHTRMEDYTEALNLYQKGLKLSRATSNQHMIARIQANISELYLRNKAYNQAIKALQESLEISQAEKDYVQVVATLGNMAEVYEEKKQLDSALFFNQRAIGLHKEYKLKGGIVLRYVSLAQIYNDLNKPDSSSYFYKKALQQIPQNTITPALLNVYTAMYTQYAKHGQYNEAYSYLLKHNLVKDSLFTLQKNKQIEELKAKYQLDAKQKELDLLAKQNQLRITEAKLQKRLNYALLAIALGLLLIVVLLTRGYQQKRKNNQSLGLKNDQITQMLRDKEVLLKEVHHRVKNNLQIVSSLLNLQQEFHQEQSPQELLRQSQSKIEAMAIIHEQLYQSDNIQSIDLHTYLTELITHFNRSYDLDQRNITFQTNIAPLGLSLDQLVPCGLIINELVTNCIKYAFVGKTSGQVSIEAQVVGEKYQLVLADNGVGLPQGFNVQEITSLGLRLVQGLVQQLQGKFEVLQPSKGASFQVSFGV